jgi:hypothetical protein
MVSPLVVSSAAFIGPYPQHGQASNAFPGRGVLRAPDAPYEAVLTWTLAGSKRSSSLNSWRRLASSTGGCRGCSYLPIAGERPAHQHLRGADRPTPGNSSSHGAITAPHPLAAGLQEGGQPSAVAAGTLYRPAAPTGQLITKATQTSA